MFRDLLQRNRQRRLSPRRRPDGLAAAEVRAVETDPELAQTVNALKEAVAKQGENNQRDARNSQPAGTNAEPTGTVNLYHEQHCYKTGEKR